MERIHRSGLGGVGCLCALCVLCAAACALDTTRMGVEPDREVFEASVQPQLLADCSFFACHGDPARPFRLYSSSGLRLAQSEETRFAPLTREEQDHNYRAAVLYALSGEGYGGMPLLLAKPLAEEAGGAVHGGLRLRHQGAVYPDRDDPVFALLECWVQGGSGVGGTCGGDK